MALNGDPYRTLGLARGATLEEVKRAYRRLAKANHPDAAGIGSLPRFLAIQAAYDQLTGDTQNPAQTPRSPAASAKRRSGAASERADATRRAYGGRPKGQRPSGDNAQPGPRPSRASPGTGDSGATAGRRGKEGQNDPGAARRGPTDRAGEPAAGTPGRRGKATLGSTSYDGADAGPFEPDWGGASWYGTTSGTYWTINPKEYADPRKHGPDYQARAKRASAGRPEPDPSPGRDATEPQRGPEPVHGDSGPTHTTGSWWDSTTEPAEPEADRAADPGAAADRQQPTFHEPGPDPARAAADLVRAIVDPGSGGFRGRIARAFVGWLPIALGLGWLFGELTGCGRFAATCDSSVEPLILVVQGGALVGLLLLPVVASLAASAALGLLAASVAATLVLSATGGAADEASRRATLGVLLVVAWVAGLFIAIGQRIRSASARSGPVS